MHIQVKKSSHSYIKNKVDYPDEWTYKDSSCCVQTSDLKKIIETPKRLFNIWQETSKRHIADQQNTLKNMSYICKLWHVINVSKDVHVLSGLRARETDHKLLSLKYTRLVTCKHKKMLFILLKNPSLHTTHKKHWSFHFGLKISDIPIHRNPSRFPSSRYTYSVL